MRVGVGARMKEKGDEYGLIRREGIAFIIPGRGVAAMNMTHVETPLDPLEASARTLDGRDQADRAVAFLRSKTQPNMLCIQSMDTRYTR